MLRQLVFLLFVSRLSAIESSDYPQNRKQRCTANGVCTDPDYMEDIGDCETINSECTSKNPKANCQFIENTDKSLILCVDVDKFYDIPNAKNFDHILSDPSCSCFTPENKMEPIYDIICKTFNGKCKEDGNKIKCEFSRKTAEIIKAVQDQHAAAKKDKFKRNLLLAFDGTGSEMQFESDNRNDPKHDRQKWKSEIGVHVIDDVDEWIWRSHVANFWEDYEGESHYWYGPDDNLLWHAGSECQVTGIKGYNKACKFIEKLYNDDDPDDSYFIDIIGFSRGGYIAMEVSRKLQFDGCRIKINDTDEHIKPINVRWMGLYDPVRRVAQLKNFWEYIGESEYDADKVASTVQNVSIAERSKEINSREYFGYGADGGCDNKQKNTCIINEFDNTSHSGVGGSPGSGDCHDGCSILDVFTLCWRCSDLYTVDKDKSASADLDSWMRQNAVDNDVPIRITTERYYSYKDKPFVPYK
eukprot:166645_1